ncbi:alpha-L-rhamnosidase C-terminal domain-containing protein, partial [Stieleria sp.]|uniref:alpha-L-rhamnosidase C-terminal domain-containing protein n=1 Tax=Stieleria sp. TaxID=2795976 RepID=UPI0035626FC9
WNHAWGAAPANLLPRHVLGAQPRTPGWTTATIRPCPADIESARGKVPTPRGPIKIDWTNGEAFNLSLSLPDGMSAVVELPAPDGSTGVFADGTAMAATKRGDRWHVDGEVTGSVRFEVK